MIRHPETIEFWVGRLPRWEVVDGRYFVTIHLSGAIPQAGQERILAASAELRAAQSNRDQRLKLQRKIFAEMENWLDSAEHRTDLADQRVAEMVMEAIEHRVQLGVWTMFEYVIMPSHVHLFFELGKDRLKLVLEGFKDWTGSRAARILRFEEARFWQKEWFDHWSRSDDEDERIAEYIRQNPVKARLVSDFVQWPYESWSPLAASLRINRPLPGSLAAPVPPRPSGTTL
jgi:putative transposase